MKTLKTYTKESLNLIKSAIKAKAGLRLIVATLMLVLLAVFTKVVFGVVNVSVYSLF
jgi:hypothetical protein